MNEEMFYEVEIRTGILKKMYKNFDSYESAYNEVERLKKEGFKNVKFRRVRIKIEYL